MTSQSSFAGSWLISCLSILAASTADLASAQCTVTEVAKLVATDADPSDLFGSSAALDGDVAAIGSPFDDNVYGGDAGAVYVYRFDGVNWVLDATLHAADGAAADQFGVDVAVSGDVIIVGARLDDDAGSGSGSAYIFRYDGSSWNQEDKLTASDAAANDLFGGSVAAAENVVIVGAIGQDNGGEETGAAYVYRIDGADWTQDAKLVAADAAEQDWFGSGVAITSSRALVGAYGKSDVEPRSGAAYLFQYNGSAWVQETKLIASDAAASDNFGREVALDSATALIGAPENDDDGAASGSTYVFTFDGSTWTELAKLTASDAAAGSTFGSALSISGDWAVIGAPSASLTGAAYVFRRTGGNWTEASILTQSDGASLDSFGVSVSVSGERALSGARYHDTPLGIDAGALYVFSGITDCNSNGVVDSCDLADGTSTDCDHNGIPDECEDSDDDDDDGVSDCDDLCPNTPFGTTVDEQGCPADDCNANGIPDDDDIANGNSEDCNANGIPDECESDADGDGVPDDCDNCPTVPNANQADSDGDGIGDACEDSVPEEPPVNGDGDNSADGSGDTGGNGSQDGTDPGDSTDDGAPNGDPNADDESEDPLSDPDLTGACGAGACGVLPLGYVPAVLIGMCFLKIRYRTNRTRR